MSLTNRRTVMWILCVTAVAPGCVSHGTGSSGQGTSPPFAAARPLPNIIGTQWRCTEIADANGSLVPVTGEPPTLLIGADDKVSGFAGVNRYFSTATFGNAMVPPIPLTFGPIGATRMAGPPERMELERAFMAMLGRIRSAEVVAGRGAVASECADPDTTHATLVLHGDDILLARLIQVSAGARPRP